MIKKLLASLLTLILLISVSWSQEDESAEEPVVVPGAVGLPDDAPDVAADDAELVVDDDLDDQLYVEDDDEFVPTEEIPADEPIPFPSNI
ncbi:MAG: hypothetical protein HOI35_12215 [Woeseia sp.]|jgi:hypothetical protein|nr:hypothetical protein [Woeseia sp.]MBT6210772.1 hypothetical protein [Woeseia sp.]